MIRSAVLAVTERSLTKKIVTDTAVGRAVAHRFVAGDNLEAAVEVARTLNADGMAVSLDHLGEHVASVEDAASARDSYLACLGEISSKGLDANIAVKLTQLGMGLDDSVAAQHLDTIAAAASEASTTVTIDMEESAHTSTTLALYEAAQKKHGNLGVAVQAYLMRTADDIDRISALGGHIRLCKGAYMESADVAFQTAEEVNASFDRLSDQLMGYADVLPAIASHDDGRINRVIRAASGRPGDWEFQMLYGIRRDRQVELVGLGLKMRIYVPYGEAWYPYLTRRMAERPANLMFFARALVGR